jgi:hypothetical protein
MARPGIYFNMNFSATINLPQRCNKILIYILYLARLIISHVSGVVVCPNMFRNIKADMFRIYSSCTKKVIRDVASILSKIGTLLFCVKSFNYKYKRNCFFSLLKFVTRIGSL